jgi:hypothetical protein
VLSVNPTTVNVLGTGAANAQGISVKETGYTGSFSETDTCSGIATVTTASASGPSASYTTTGVAVGSCSATFKDASHQSQTAAITVTTTNYTVQGRSGAKN